MIIFLYLGKFIDYALHDLHALTARHWYKTTKSLPITWLNKPLDISPFTKNLF